MGSPGITDLLFPGLESHGIQVWVVESHEKQNNLGSFASAN